MRIENRSPFKKTNPEYRIENKTDETTVYLYDEIGYFGVTAKQFAKDLEGIKSKTINLRINSPGGSVFDGTSIYNILKQHPANIVVHIDGLAASIASIIALAGNEVRMAKNALYMIHEPWSMVIGSSSDMRKEADLLDKARGTLTGTYVSKTGLEESEILALMSDETWFTADEALEKGFIDSIYDDKIEEKAMNLFDLSAFGKVPDKLRADTEDKDINEREVEKILRDAGLSRRQAKAIIAEGLNPDLRDADPAGPDAPAETLRDAVVKPVNGKKSTEELLSRAELMAPAVN